MTKKKWAVVWAILFIGLIFMFPKTGILCLFGLYIWSKATS